MQCVKCKA
uniref:Uncharacterized protein n=1 Tax=Anguilla anguilla TaxID=7936 RepID=A0A0E9XYQ9_ANGAN